MPVFMGLVAQWIHGVDSPSIKASNHGMHRIHRLRYAAVLFGLAASTFFIAMGGDRTLMSAPWWLLLGTLGSLSLLLGFSFYFKVPLGGPWTATGLLFGVSLFLVMWKQRRG